jgi:hypothetical protein
MKKSNNVVINGCGHCRNLKMPWTKHNVSDCPVLAETTCPSCGNKGHTSTYCPEKMKVVVEKVSEPIANGWAKIAKKAMTDKDLAESAAIELKRKADLAEKKKNEHEAYLERKAIREQRAKEKKQRDDANYVLYRQHMLYLHGHGWFHKFDERGDKAGEIPEQFYSRVQNEIREDERLDWEMEMRELKEEQEEIFRNKMKLQRLKEVRDEKKLTLSPEEFEVWKKKISQDEFKKFNEEVDEYLDQGFSAYSQQKWREKMTEENGKRWLDEKMQFGNIVLGKDGKYRYYA